jgi:hypothetical protein
LLRLIWSLALGLTLLCWGAQAVQCHDGCQKRAGIGDSSIQLTTQRDRDLQGTPYPLVDTLPSHPRKKDELPPSLRDDSRASERNRIAVLPTLFGGGLSESRAAVRRRRSH